METGRWVRSDKNIKCWYSITLYRHGHSAGAGSTASTKYSCAMTRKIGKSWHKCKWDVRRKFQFQISLLWKKASLTLYAETIQQHQFLIQILKRTHALSSTGQVHNRVGLSLQVRSPPNWTSDEVALCTCIHEELPDLNPLFSSLITPVKLGIASTESWMLLASYI